MHQKTKFLSIIILLQTFAILSLIYIVISIRSFANEQLKNNLSNYLGEKQEEITIPLEEKVDLTANVAASLVWWDQDKGFESIQGYGKYMNSISPFWYELTIEGKIETFSGAEDTEIIDYLKANSIKIVPIISNEFEPEPLASIIADPTKRAAHIQDILEIANQYDGISLNYENLNVEDKDNYTQFMTEVAEELHENNKILFIHLHAKTEEPGTWNGPQSQDWESLGEICDKMKIMAYDYHWSTSEAGPIAPPEWVEEVIQHAASIIPKEKIYLGIPLYGYDWIGEEGTGVTYDEAMTLSNLNNAAVQLDTETNSPFFTYSDDEENAHEVWFENAQSIKYKLDIAKQYQIGGIDFFRLGSEDINLWEEVNNTFKIE